MQMEIKQPLLEGESPLQNTSETDTLELEVNENSPSSNNEIIMNVDPPNQTSVRMAANLSLGANIILLITKAVVFGMSLSIAVVASLVDSMLDLISQAIMFWTERNVTHISKTYPVGRTRLEPVGIMTVSILMVMSAFTVIREGMNRLIKENWDITFTVYTIVPMLCVIAVKFCLWLYCRRYKHSPIAMALAEDHANDVASNSIALAAAIVAAKVNEMGWLDATGGILISFYIIYSWWRIGTEEMRKLVGMKADDEWVSEIRVLCDSHHDQMSVDVLRAYHVGRNILVEVEVIMPQHFTLKIAHDVSIKLQQKIEKFEYVERSFVHVDYKSRDYDEHKKPVLL